MATYSVLKFLWYNLNMALEIYTHILISCGQLFQKKLQCPEILSLESMFLFVMYSYIHI